MTSLTLTSSSAASLRVDAVVVGVGKGPRGPVLAPGSSDVDGAFSGRLGTTLAALGATGAAGEVVRTATLGALRAPVLLAVGLGPVPGRGEAYDHESVRRGAGTALRALAGTARVGLALPAEDASQVGAVAEGALLGAYAYLRYRTTSMADHKPPAGAVTVVSPAGRERAARAALDRAVTVASAVGLARDLVNAPPSDLPPDALAAAAVDAADGRALEVSVLDEDELRSGGYGGILGVGQGSAKPPRLVRLAYRPEGAQVHLALVGKGITFDSGGLSLKTATGMESMKSDMGGAAAVLAAMTAIADLGPVVDVTGWLPIAENMPSGTAQRPSDVLTMRGGKTVEVMNTDAEGRLVLADALVDAVAEAPDLVVDAATLTGAQLVALGSRTSAIMSNREALLATLQTVAERAGEAMWPMPLPSELRRSMDSAVADISNMGDRYGGMLVAGLFLKEFVGDDVPWAHLDIAGPAWNEGDAWGYTPRGGTGAAVRTFVALAEDLASGAVAL